MKQVVRRSVRQVLAIAPVLGCLAVAACNKTAKGPIDVPLTYTPQHADPLPALSLPATGIPAVYVAPVKDARGDTSVIGSNVEDATPLPVRAADVTVEQFVADVFRQEFRAAGLDVVDTAGRASRSVAMEVLEFGVVESDTYRASVRLRATVRDGSGTTLWTGVAGGAATNWGRSRKPENYRQALSDATKRSVAQLMSLQPFTQTLTSGAPATPAASPATMPAPVPSPTPPTAIDPSPLPARPEPAKPTPPAPEPTQPEPAKPEPTKPEPTKPDVAQPEPVKPEPAKPEPAKPDSPSAEAPDRPEPVRPEPAKPEPTKPEPAKPEPTPPESVKAVESAEPRPLPSPTTKPAAKD